MIGLSEIDPTGINLGGAPAGPDGAHLVRMDQTRIPLHGVLEFTARSIDVVNDPIARNQVRRYFRLYRLIERRCESAGSSGRHSP